ncbi:UNVERIFIED_CONTAM: hypothetical protein GTU68_027309 [Idotea baltica]|nr:hypothetical protein [Idotea baltica]
MMQDETRSSQFFRNIALFQSVGIKIVLVHGGGPAVSEYLKSTGRETSFHKGLRITKPEDMADIEMVLSGKVNKSIVNNLQKANLKAVGISGKDASTLLCVKKEVAGVDLGQVGEIKEVNNDLITSLVESDFIPVVASIAIDKDGNTFNINADNAALELATSLNARKLIYISDVPGVLKNIEDSNSLFSILSASEAKKLISDKIIEGGMLPKVQCCVKAVESGVSEVHLLDGRIENSVLLEIFTDKGVGTIFTL